MGKVIKEINLHITEFCEGKCPMCYATDEKMVRKHGDIEILKLIVHNAVLNGGVDRFVMVGGDPCEHPYLVNLLKYIKAEGEKYGVNTKTMIISNTHNYLEDGKTVKIKDIYKYIDEMVVTVHGATAESHDSFNGCPGSYNKVMNNINEYIKYKSNKQGICVIVNLMPDTVRDLKNIVINTNKMLNGKVNGLAIHRIAPIGRACGSKQYFIDREDVNIAFESLSELKQKYGFYLEFVDAFPFCSVDHKYWSMLPKGGCNWGKDYCAVFSDGSVTRCAMSNNKLSKKITELDTPEKFKEFWENDRELVMFRKMEHIDDKCKNCRLLSVCGGGCVLARESGDPYKNGIVEKGFDYLAKR